MLLYYKISTFLLAIIIFVQISVGQNIISFNFIPDDDTLDIYSFYGTTITKIGSLNQNNLQTNLPEKYSGFIRIKNNNKYEDFIIENESLVFLYDSTLQNIKYNSSSLSNLYYQRVKNIYSQYSSQINQSTDVEKLNLKLIRNYKIDSILNIDTNSFFSVSTKLALHETHHLTPYQIIDLIPLKSNLLIHCSIIPNYLINAMRKINGPDDNELKKLIHYIFDKEINEETRELILSFLIEFFTSTHSDSILNFISTNYLESNYCNSSLSLKASQKLQQIELYKIGNKLPDIEINDKKLTKILKKYSKKDIILIVWSLDCPHCHDLLKRLESERQNNIIYIGIELSENTNDKLFRNVFELSIKDEKGWNGNLANEWMIDRTPLLLKIKSDLTILELLEP